MNNEVYRKTMKLSAANIDQVSDYVAGYLARIEVERETALRIRLSLEEALLRFRDRFTPEKEFTVFIGPKLRHYEIQIELADAAYNPLVRSNDEMGNWSSTLLTGIGLFPHYSYSPGRNFLRLVIPRKHMNSVLKLLIFIAIGIVGGLLGKALLSEEIMTVIINSVLTPLSDLFTRMLNALSGPLSFLMVVIAVMNLSRIREQGADSKSIIVRYFVISLITAIIAAGLSSGIMPVHYTGSTVTSKVIEEILDVFFSVMPNDMVVPFMESNTPQLVLLALVFGNALALLQHETDTLIRFTRQAYSVGLLMAEWVSRSVPFFTAVLLMLEIWIGNPEMFLGLWKCVLLYLFLTFSAMMVSLVRASLQKKVNIPLLIRKLKKSFMKTLRTGSLDEALTSIENCCVRSLGIDKHFAGAGLPTGLVLYMPVSIIELIVFTIYIAGVFGMETSAVWYILLLFLSVVLSVAASPVSGVSLLSFAVVFHQLGIPGRALIVGMVIDMILGPLTTAGNQMMLQLELLMQADRIGLVDDELLHADNTESAAVGD